MLRRTLCNLSPPRKDVYVMIYTYNIQVGSWSRLSIKKAKRAKSSRTRRRRFIFLSLNMLVAGVCHYKRNKKRERGKGGIFFFFLYENKRDSSGTSIQQIATVTLFWKRYIFLYHTHTRTHVTKERMIIWILQEVCLTIFAYLSHVISHFGILNSLI